MDFNNIVDKAKQGFEVVYKKTEDVVNVSKMKLDKASLEAKLSKSYEMLGQICYQSVISGENFESEEVKVLVDDITDNIAEIEELDIKIQGLKNKKLCPKCHSSIDVNSVFCSNCGEKVE